MKILKKKNHPTGNAMFTYVCKLKLVKLLSYNTNLY